MTKSKEKSHTLPERFWDAYRQEKRREEFSVRKTKVYAKKAGCIARGQEAPVRGAARQMRKMSNKRRRLLTAALRALCGRAGWGRGKQNGKPAETFCFSGFGRSINLLGRLQIFGRFVGDA